MKPIDAAVLVACGCNAAMAGGDFDRTTRLINGKAMAGAAERRALFEVCRGVIA